MGWGQVEQFQGSSQCFFPYLRFRPVIFENVPFRIGVYPLKIRPFPQPGQLPLGQLPGRSYRPIHRLFQRKLRIQVLPQLPVPHRPHRWQRWIKVTPLVQRLYLVEETGADHLVEP